MAAAALPAAAGCGCGGAGVGSIAGSGFLPSSSRMSAPSPRPSAFLAIMDHLLGQMRVALGPFAVHVVKNNGLAEARRFRKPIILYDVHSKGAEGYTHLAKEVIHNGEKRTGTGTRSAH